MENEIVVPDKPRFISRCTVETLQHMGGDHMIVAAAKASTNGADARRYADMEMSKKNAGIIRYLMKHRHGSPFEHSAVTFSVHAPIFVWREWHRHRIGFSYNEESARYTILKPVFYVPPADRSMLKVDGWKPGRPKFLPLETEKEKRDYERLCEDIKDTANFGYERYIRNINRNFDPGLARICLPVSTFSTCIVTCNPRSLMSFLSLRTHEPTATFVSYPLYEIEQAARLCEKVLQEIWPITYAAFCEHGRVAP